MKNGNNSKYFAAANAFLAERFAGVDGFNNFVDDYTYSAEGAGGSVEKYNSSTSQPYEIIVTNSNLVETIVTIFNSYQNRNAFNFGNVAGITIVSAVTTTTYSALLAQSEKKNFEVGEVYIEVISGSNAVLTRPITQTIADASGDGEYSILRPKKDPNQNQANVLDFKKSFKINGYTNLQVLIPAGTSVQYSFYPSATQDGGRTLGNMPAVRDYRAPVITKPTPIAISPAILQALGRK